MFLFFDTIISSLFCDSFFKYSISSLSFSVPCSLLSWNDFITSFNSKIFFSFSSTFFLIYINSLLSSVFLSSVSFFFIISNLFFSSLSFFSFSNLAILLIIVFFPSPSSNTIKFSILAFNSYVLLISSFNFSLVFFNSSSNFSINSLYCILLFFLFSSGFIWLTTFGMIILVSPTVLFWSKILLLLIILLIIIFRLLSLLSLLLIILLSLLLLVLLFSSL